MSECGTYRYSLVRIWDGTKQLLDVVMLNPSTADAELDDPTILALIHFATLWGFGGIRVANLNAFRASQPSAMIAAHQAGKDVAGPANQDVLNATLVAARKYSRPVLVAWGTGGNFRDADLAFATAADALGVTLVCLGRTANGSPKHPMARGKHRIPRDQQPETWRWAA